MAGSGFPDPVTPSPLFVELLGDTYCKDSREPRAPCPLNVPYLRNCDSNTGTLGRDRFLGPPLLLPPMKESCLLENW